MYPENMVIPEEMKLKLSIKSSLPKTKQLLAFAFIAWNLNNKETSIMISYANTPEDKATITEELFNLFNAYFEEELSESNLSESDFKKVLNENPLIYTHMEALLVALELIWRVAKVEFVNENLAYSAERNDILRYSKNILPTKNMDSIELLYSMNEDEFKKILFNWLTKKDIAFNSEFERKLIKAFTLLSEESIYKLNQEDSKIHFQNKGIYSKFTDDDTKVDITGTKEPMGSLRILKSLLKEQLNYYLTADSRYASLNSNVTLEELNAYAKRVSNYLELVSIDFDEIIEDTSEPQTQEQEPNTSEETFAFDITAFKDLKEYNLIYYGSPGTGKSYTLKKDATVFNNNFKRITFHPSTTYSHFVGTLKPTMIYKNHENSSSYSNYSYSIEDLNSRPEFELYPLINEPLITYEFVPGVFIEQLVSALKNPDEYFLLIIEELNRANVSSVFGDIFQLLDRDDKGKSEYSISISKELKVYLRHQLGYDINELMIPDNLYIWATMNTSDQGVMPLDSAFKRRWDFKYINIDGNVDGDDKIADTDLINVDLKYFGDNIRWGLFRKALNDKLVDIGVNEDKLIGPYFFKEDVLNDNKRFQKNFKNKLLMYLFNDVIRQKEKLFNPSLKTLSKLFEAYDDKINVQNVFQFELIDEETDEIHVIEEDINE